LTLLLVERSEAEIAQTVKRRIEMIKEMKGYHQLSVLITGKIDYIEMHVLLDRNLMKQLTGSLK